MDLHWDTESQPNTNQSTLIVSAEEGREPVRWRQHDDSEIPRG
jgi:hypothetical protein